MQAVILAGGFGTRLRPLTADMPKPMLPINGVPILEHILKGLVSAGVDKIIISTGYLPEVIMDHFGDGSAFNTSIAYSHEASPLGTGGAVKQANGTNMDPFLLVWGDNLHDVDYAALLSAHASGVTMALTRREDVEHFGVAQIEGNKIIGFLEKPARHETTSNWINTGVFVVNPEVLDMLKSGVSSIEKECFEKIANNDLYAHFHTGQWFPTDTKEKYDLAQSFDPNLQ